MIDPNKIYNRKDILKESEELKGLALLIKNLFDMVTLKSVLDKVEIVPYNKEEENKK